MHHPRFHSEAPDTARGHLQEGSIEKLMDHDRLRVHVLDANIYLLQSLYEGQRRDRQKCLHSLLPPNYQDAERDNRNRGRCKRQVVRCNLVKDGLIGVTVLDEQSKR